MDADVEYTYVEYKKWYGNDKHAPLNVMMNF